MSLLNIFRPKWQHSDPAVRLQAVQSLGAENQDALVAVARADANAEVRRAALRKVSSVEVLRELSQSEADSENKTIAQGRMQDELVRVLKNHTGHVGESELQKVRSMEGSRHLEDLLRNAISPMIRAAVASVCSRQGLLVQVALKDADESVAFAALAGIDRENLLEEVASHSRHAAVRQRAGETLKAKAPAVDPAAEAAALSLRKREALLSQAVRLSEAREFFKVESDYALLASEATRLGMGELQASFDALYTEFRAKCDGERERQAEEIRAREARAQQAAELEAVLQDMESLANDSQAASDQGRIAQIVERWNALGGASSDLNRRFASAQNRLARQQQRQSEPENHLDEAQISAAREDTIAQLKALSAREDVDDAMERQLRGLVRTWESLPLVEGDDPQLQSYIHLRDQLGQRLRNQSESRQQAYEAKLSDLQAIIARVEAIDENQDFREIAKTLRQTYLDWKQTVGEDKFQYQEIWKEYRKSTARFQEMQQWESWHNEKDREALIEEMAKLAGQEASSEVLARVRQLQTHWKNVGPVAQPRMQELWEKFKEALDQVMDQCRPFIEEQNRERQSNFETKALICEKVETLAADTGDNWKDKHKEMQAIQESWKNAGPVPKEHNQPLWDRFRAACDVFYHNHKEFLRKEDGERQENLTQKVSLCEQAEALRDSTDWNAATARLKKLQDEWKASGPVPKSQSETIWNRFREACDAFFERKRTHFEQLDSTKLENLRRKEALCVQLEAMDLDPTQPEVVDAVVKIEEEWKSIGMVPKEAVDALWDRFCSSTDRFLEKLAERDSGLRTELDTRLETKQAMIEQVGILADQAGSNQSADAVRAIQEEWKHLGRCGTREQELYRKFREVCDEFFTRRRDQLEIQEQARQNNLQKKQILCEQAERLLGGEASQHEAMGEVKHLRRLWKEIGAVPREHSDRIWKRFNSACDAVFAQGKPVGQVQGQAQD